MKYKVNWTVIEHLIVNTKPKLGKYKLQYIGNPNLCEIKSTCHNTADINLHSSWATWNTKLMGLVIKHLTLNTKPKLEKYKPQSTIGNPNLRKTKSTWHQSLSQTIYLEGLTRPYQNWRMKSKRVKERGRFTL